VLGCFKIRHGGHGGGGGNESVLGFNTSELRGGRFV
jgi:hypothetical protein